MKYQRKTIPQSQIEKAAEAAHEVNRAYCRALGDYSQPPWSEAPKWQRESAVAGVTGIVRHPDRTPEESHENWCLNKREAGWRYGEDKDPEEKTHPCLVGYEELPAAQRAKDALFGATVRGVLGL